jgi:hypothetical protein
MCPIHETDLAEERWSQAEWEHYELWEKIEARARRIRRLWIASAVLGFFILSAVPVVMERGVQWKALKASREFGQKVNSLKREAGERQQAFRIRVHPSRPLALTVEWGPHCDSPMFLEAQELALIESDRSRDRLGWVAAERGRELGIPGLLQEFCFDPLHGSRQTPGENDLAAFMIGPVSELAPEQVASVLLHGPTAEISFE